MSARALRVRRVRDITKQKEVEWLVEGLWAFPAVGFLCGPPKSGKTWLAMDIALSVATGTPALGTFAVPGAGPVLHYPAEDSQEMVRTRLDSLARQRGLDLDTLRIGLIETPVLRLDQEDDQAKLLATVKKHQPRLLVLDPFVRIQRIDENSAQDVGKVLSYLREVQRRHQVAILVVHHARKNGGGRPGMALRGSGDLWAWGDSNLYVNRRDDGIRLQVEHRNAPSPPGIRYELAEGEHGPYLRLLEPVDATVAAPVPRPLRDRIVDHLKEEGRPCTQDAIRRVLRVKAQAIVECMRELTAEGKLHRTTEGWSLCS